LKPKKTNRAFRCTDTLYSMIEQAAASEEMSINQWIEYAIRSQLKEGVQVDALDVSEAAQIATADALTSIASTIESTQKKMSENLKRLNSELAAVKAKRKEIKQTRK
jgi:hypothetical protein